MQKSQDASTGLVDVESAKRSDSVKPDIPSSPRPIEKSLRETIEQKWGAVPDELWLRGKKVLWANPEARSVWSSGRTIRNGKVAIPGQVEAP